MNLADLQLPGTLEDLKQARLQEAARKEKIAEDLARPVAVTPTTPSAHFEESPYKFDPLFGLNDLVDVWHMMYPDTKLYPWQAEELLRISGYIDGRRSGPRLHWTPESPLLAAYVCCNDSGKDMVIIATSAIGLPLLYRNTRVVITSSSHVQLKQQTQVHIERGIKALNARCGTRIYNSVEFCHTCPERGGEIQMFATDEPGRAEGWHPLTKDGRLVIIKNEAKSIPENIHVALERCHGYSHWLEISSPGPRAGKLFRTFKDSTKYPARPEAYRYFGRKVDWTLCPHISPKLFELKSNEHGLNSYFIQTSFLANFYEQEEDTVIPLSLLLNLDNLKFRPDHTDVGIGLDSAAGTDETSLYVRFGPVATRKLFFKERDTIKAAARIHDAIADLQDKPYTFDIDDGGISRTFTDQLTKLGWRLRRRLNNSKAVTPARFMNLGTEMMWHVRTLLERGQISSPEDELTRTQLTTRKFDETENLGRKMLMSKKSMKQLGMESPDRADAFVLCFWSYRPERFHQPPQESDPLPETLTKITQDELISRSLSDPTFYDSLVTPKPKPGPGFAYTLLTHSKPL